MYHGKFLAERITVADEVTGRNGLGWTLCLAPSMWVASIMFTHSVCSTFCRYVTSSKPVIKRAKLSRDGLAVHKLFALSSLLQLKQSSGEELHDLWSQIVVRSGATVSETLTSNVCQTLTYR